MKPAKLFLKAMSAPQNLRFAELCRLAEAFGYTLDRINGSHHLFVHPKATRPLNFQEVGGKAKPYQVKQFLRDIEEFNLTMGS
jgi:predicted RNA binding protein YcfA (HicA-like mRNA interferase family)